MYNTRPSYAYQRNAIRMAFHWWAYDVGWCTVLYVYVNNEPISTYNFRDGNDLAIEYI